jgi:6,7-dimethyl-8-ribityllumazine synthase
MAPPPDDDDAPATGARRRAATPPHGKDSPGRTTERTRSELQRQDPRGHVPWTASTRLRVGIVAARFNEAIVRPLVDGATVDALLRHGRQPRTSRSPGCPAPSSCPWCSTGSPPAVRSTPSSRSAAWCAVRPPLRLRRRRVRVGRTAVHRAHARDPGRLRGADHRHWEQAVERAGGKLGNKGAEAALAAVETATAAAERCERGTAPEPTPRRILHRPATGPRDKRAAIGDEQHVTSTGPRPGRAVLRGGPRHGRSPPPPIARVHVPGRFERDVTAHHHASRRARFTFGDVESLAFGRLDLADGETCTSAGCR